MAIDVSAVGRVLGIDTAFVDTRNGAVRYLPQRIAVFAQGESGTVYNTHKFRATRAGPVGERFGYRSPLHHIARALFPQNVDAGVGTIPVTLYPLEEHPEGVAATGAIAPEGDLREAGNYRVVVNTLRSLAFRLEPGMTRQAIGQAMAKAVTDTPDLPITLDAQGVATAAWKGRSSDCIRLSVEGPDAGLTWTITQPSGGAANPDISAALARMGSTWETLVLNAGCFDDVETLDRLRDFGEARWGQLTRKPLVAFTGNVEAQVQEATRISATRRTDRVNAYLVAPGSEDMPFLVAARQLVSIARTAGNNPPRDYGSQAVPAITPGPDAQQWDYLQRERAVTSGCSTVDTRDGVLHIQDVVTCYRPSGEEPPGYRHVVDICKLANCIFNLDLEFAQPKWDGAPIIPSSQPTTNPAAKRPSDVKATICGILDSLGLEAIISDPETAKTNTQVAISSQNPKRLDVTVPIQVSGNLNINSIDLNFGFFFGS